MSLQQCLNKECGSRHVYSQPDGRNLEFPWLVSHQCVLCHSFWFTCNGTCGGRRGYNRNYSSVYPTMRQARRHNLQCHGDSSSAEPTSVIVTTETYRYFDVEVQFGPPGRVDTAIDPLFASTEDSLQILDLANLDSDAITSNDDYPGLVEEESCNRSTV
jgi:hypothetical protein